MTYRVERNKKAAKYFIRSDEALKKQFQKKIHLLQEDPHNSRKLLDIEIMQGSENAYRRRLGDYRMIYAVLDDLLVILMLDVGARGDIYKKR